MSAPRGGSTDARRAQPASVRILAQARFEAAGLLRHGEQLLVSMILPVLALLALAWTSVPDLGAGRRIDLATAGVLGLAVISTAFTGQAILLAYERRYGVLRLLGTTPLGTSGLVLAKAGAVAIVVAVQMVVLGGVALVLGWRPDIGGLLPAVLLIGLGVVAFAAWAAVLGGTLQAEATLAVANLVWVLLLGVGGVVFSTELLPDAVAAVVSWLPSAALGDGLRGALTVGGWPWASLGLLALWSGAGVAIAARVIRWSD